MYSVGVVIVKIVVRVLGSWVMGYRFVGCDLLRLVGFLGVGGGGGRL